MTKITHTPKTEGQDNNEREGLEGREILVGKNIVKHMFDQKGQYAVCGAEQDHAHDCGKKRTVEVGPQIQQQTPVNSHNSARLNERLANTLKIKSAARWAAPGSPSLVRTSRNPSWATLYAWASVSNRRASAAIRSGLTAL